MSLQIPAISDSDSAQAVDVSEAELNHGAKKVMGGHVQVQYAVQYGVLVVLHLQQDHDHISKK